MVYEIFFYHDTLDEICICTCCWYKFISHFPLFSSIFIFFIYKHRLDMRLKTTYHSQLAVAVQFSYKTCNRIMIKNNLQEFLYIYSNRKSVCLRRYLFCVFYRIMYRYVRQPSGSVSFYQINIGNSF